MFEVNGKPFKQLVLGGGGLTMLGLSLGFFKQLDFFNDLQNVTVPLISSSAGSLGVFLAIMMRLGKLGEEDIEKCVSRFNELFCVSNVLERVDDRHLISNEEVMMLFPDQVKKITFYDLMNDIPHLNWTVICSRRNDFQFFFDSFGTRTPDISVLDAVVASFSIPIIFEPVKINGKYYCDGDATDWVQSLLIHEDTSSFSIMVAPTNIEIDTGLLLLDEVLRLVTLSIKSQILKTDTKSENTYQCLHPASLNIHWSEFADEGKELAHLFVLK